jgi:hypothetical protein
VRGSAVSVGGLERRGTNWGACGQETVRCVVHAQKAGDRGGGGAVHGVGGALCQLRMEAEWSCEGGEGGKGLCGGCWGALQEGIFCTRQRLCQAHCYDLLEWPLQSEGKQQQSVGVALSDPAL